MELDLIFSIGPACRPAYHLKHNFLRLFSCPLDWQMNYSLNTCLHLFQTSFKTFFAEIRENTERKGAHENRCIIDVQNSITSIHYFDARLPLEEAHAIFRTTMQKRFQALHEAISCAHTVGLICNRQDAPEDLASFLQAFGMIYENTKFILINIRDNQCLTSVTENEYSLSPRLQIKEYAFCDRYQQLEAEPENEWLGNVELWNRVLQDYTITNHPVIEYIKSFNKPVYIYGAGIYCLKLKHFLEKYHITPELIVVTSPDTNPDCIEDIPVMPYNKLLAHESLIIISVIDQGISQKIYNRLKADGFQHVSRFDSALQLVH